MLDEGSVGAGRHATFACGQRNQTHAYVWVDTCRVLASAQKAYGKALWSRNAVLIRPQKHQNLSKPIRFRHVNDGLCTYACGTKYNTWLNIPRANTVYAWGSMDCHSPKLMKDTHANVAAWDDTFWFFNSLHNCGNLSVVGSLLVVSAVLDRDEPKPKLPPFDNAVKEVCSVVLFSCFLRVTHVLNHHCFFRLLDYSTTPQQPL